MIYNNKLDIIPFLYRFFQANQCPILFVDETNIQVQLTIEMDKALMNRPFYWHYIAATNQLGEPKQLLLTTEQVESTEKEWIHHGSPRLEQIYQLMLQENNVVQLFEIQHTDVQTMLHPWLLTNYCISYQGKQKKESFFSLGLNLINGTIVHNMMERLNLISLAPSISAYCYIISPIIKIQSGFKRIEHVITDQIQNENHNWAKESLQYMEEEIEMANYFFEDKTTEKYTKEITSIKQRFQPRISHDVINGGVIYLSNQFLQKTN